MTSHFCVDIQDSSLIPVKSIGILPFSFNKGRIWPSLRFQFLHTATQKHLSLIKNKTGQTPNWCTTGRGNLFAITCCCSFEAQRLFCGMSCISLLDQINVFFLCKKPIRERAKMKTINTNSLQMPLHLLHSASVVIVKSCLQIILPHITQPLPKTLPLNATSSVDVPKQM